MYRNKYTEVQNKKKSRKEKISNKVAVRTESSHFQMNILAFRNYCVGQKPFYTISKVNINIFVWVDHSIYLLMKP